MIGSRKEHGSERPHPRIQSRFYAPPAEFEGCFTTFYHLSLQIPGGETVSDSLQPEWGSIRFFGGDLPQAQLADSNIANARFTATGPSSRPAHFRIGSAKMWGIGFLPLGWARFFDEDASSVANMACNGEQHPIFRKFAGLADILCDPEASREEQLDALVKRMGEAMRPSREEDKIRRVHFALVDAGIESVAAFAESCEMSSRSLERVCRRYFGFAPKLLLRRQRFMRSLSTFMLNRDKNWTASLDGHYHDQAHFTREFKEFMGVSPSAYAAQDHPILTSLMEARARDWGSPAMTLDRPA